MDRLAVVLVVAACNQAPGPATPQPVERGDLTGIVTSATSNEPMQGVTVSIGAIQFTDEAGRFTFRGVPAKRTDVTFFVGDQEIHRTADILPGRVVTLVVKVPETSGDPPCTLRACQSALWVSFARRGKEIATPIDDQLGIEGTVDGVPFTCNPVPARGLTSPCPGASELRCNLATIEITAPIVTKGGCSTRTLDILGFTDKLPTTVTLKLLAGGSELATKTFSVTYRPEYPNGKRCGDPCDVATEVVELH